MKFNDLVVRISGVDGTARVAAGRTLQQVLTLRNWLMGACIVEFEQAGEDRAAYAQVLIRKLAQALTKAGCRGLSASNLKNFRQIALAYPGLDAAQLCRQLGVRRQASGELPFPSLARRATKQQLPWRDAAWMSRLFMSLTFSHLLELSRMDDAPRRAFYEVHCLKERWSVREFQRQKDSMLYERTGLSENCNAVLALARDVGLGPDTPAGQLRDPYVCEFLGIERSVTTSESDVERALCDHLQHFLFELGRDFCFVARQFRITAGNRHHYVDLLLFHRRLRCLVAIDLEPGAFEPEHLGQLRFHVDYLAEHVAYPKENPPVGILLCAERNAEVVRFATAGDDDLFVSRYQLELPTEEQLKQWLQEERVRLEQTRDDTKDRR
jgi:predicted nuclease of restriction endonuclease-like (RecB) superfamily